MERIGMTEALPMDTTMRLFSTPTYHTLRDHARFLRIIPVCPAGYLVEHPQEACQRCREQGRLVFARHNACRRDGGVALNVCKRHLHRLLQEGYLDCTEAVDWQRLKVTSARIEALLTGSNEGAAA